MKKTTAIASLALALSIVSLIAVSGFATDFNDGNVHSINYQIVLVDIQNGPGNTPTTVNVLPGADFSHVYMYGTSHLNVSGGQIAHVNAADSTTVTVTSATEISHLRAYDTSVMSIDGVQGYGHVSALGSFASNGFDPAAGSSLVDVYGGTFFTAQAWASGILRFRGGTVSGVIARDLGTIDFYGGNVSDVVTTLDGTVNVFGGSVASIGADRNGVINIYGGQIAEIRDADVSPTRVGDVHIYGTQLFWSGVVGDPVVGTLFDQTPINAPMLMELGRLHLHVIPEPNSLVLLFSVLTLIAGSNFRRRANR